MIRTRWGGWYEPGVELSPLDAIGLEQRKVFVLQTRDVEERINELSNGQSELVVLQHLQHRNDELFRTEKLGLFRLQSLNVLGSTVRGDVVAEVSDVHKNLGDGVFLWNRWHNRCLRAVAGP